jgi:antitoxin component YwqK of YwqJK toxin-antitoxin module
MRKLFLFFPVRRGFLCVIGIAATAFLFSCGNAADKAKTDSASGSKKGITVTNPLDHEPHVVKDTIFNGEHVERYDNGVIFMRGEVAGGLRHGEWVTFYKSGKEWSRGIYKAGYREGYGVSYWENGQKSSEGYYKNDQMVGKWKFWDAEGHVVEKDFGGQ